MRAVYQEKPNCAPCIDIYGIDVASECKHCMELHRYEVDVLQLGVAMNTTRLIRKIEHDRLLVGEL